MGDQKESKETFSLADVGALRLLIVVSGVILSGFAMTSGGDMVVMLLAIGLVVAMIGLSLCAVVVMRRRKNSKPKNE